MFVISGSDKCLKVSKQDPTNKQTNNKPTEAIIYHSLLLNDREQQYTQA